MMKCDKIEICSFFLNNQRLINCGFFIFSGANDEMMYLKRKQNEIKRKGYKKNNALAMK